jgi:hypothetical protein
MASLIGLSPVLSQVTGFESRLPFVGAVDPGRFKCEAPPRLVTIILFEK